MNASFIRIVHKERLLKQSPLHVNYVPKCMKIVFHVIVSNVYPVLWDFM
jgi:hypothetical protein